MNDPSAATESGERRVATTQTSLVKQVTPALELRVRRLVKSPYVIGGLVVGAAAAGYFAVMRSGKPRGARSRRRRLA